MADLNLENRIVALEQKINDLQKQVIDIPIIKLPNSYATKESARLYLFQNYKDQVDQGIICIFKVSGPTTVFDQEYDGTICIEQLAITKNTIYNGSAINDFALQDTYKGKLQWCCIWESIDKLSDSNIAIHEQVEEISRSIGLKEVSVNMTFAQNYKNIWAGQETNVTVTPTITVYYQNGTSHILTSDQISSNVTLELSEGDYNSLNISKQYYSNKVYYIRAKYKKHGTEEDEYLYSEYKPYYINTFYNNYYYVGNIDNHKDIQSWNTFELPGELSGSQFTFNNTESSNIFIKSRYTFTYADIDGSQTDINNFTTETSGVYNIYKYKSKIEKSGEITITLK